ncbi:DNA repair protein rhp42 [Paramyrothecium foliicola]|nr:DNA repair protein rhp42 [Paramyrothecium foliicola]
MMSSQEQGIPLRHQPDDVGYRLIELPPDLQHLLESETAPVLTLESSPNSAILRTPDKAYSLRQKNTSNAVIILSSNTSSADGQSSLAAISTIHETVELDPYHEKDVSSAGNVKHTDITKAQFGTDPTWPPSYRLECDSSSSLTSLSDEEFEDVPLAKRQKLEDSSDDDDVEFEDVVAPVAPAPDVPVTSGDLELTLNRDTRISLTNQFADKRGPTKRERMVRNATHCIHVMCLLWHNAVRNSWLCDAEAQAIMISHLPPKLWDEVERWRQNSGLVKLPQRAPTASGKGKSKAKAKRPNERPARDWGSSADRLEEGMVDMSHGDPLFRLMQCLVPWWKQRFSVRRPGLRKWGYMALDRLDRLTKAHKAEEYDPERFGERVATLADFRRSAQECQGSRDVGAQLFTCLLRGLGIEARLVASLQPLGFGWNKLEEAEPEKSTDGVKSEENDVKLPVTKARKKTTAKATKNAPQSKVKSQEAKRPRPSRASKASNASLDVNSDELELEYQDTDDESVVELQVTPRKAQSSTKQFDQDLDYPHYWTEVLSPVTRKYLPVDALVKKVVGTNRDLIESLEPRGGKAEKARQIMAYVVGYSSDGTAKDVTVRYLKKQMFPGRTKGARMPPEKVPIYNRHGKVKRYELFDWFKSAMSGYRRGDRKHPLTEDDDAEDGTDLKPAKPEKKEIKEGEETLQYYKQSKEFALERHLKREEALRPGAVAVKIFKNKAKGGKIEEEPVYSRKDILNVKSAETWHKQGRAPLPGERPLKKVPYRAATLNRRREILEAEAATGEKVLQGLYSFEQTDWIIPPPIKDGVIPKNEYGQVKWSTPLLITTLILMMSRNIDLFVEHMCPRGAVHVPFRGAIRVCKRLQIDYAEAVVDFEFGHRMAVPVIQGVVVAEEYHDQVMEELAKDEVEKKRKEDEKRRKTALGQWRKFLMGMRIVERIRQEYGHIDENVSVFGHNKGATIHKPTSKLEDEEMAGGFLPEGYEEDEEQEQAAHQTSSFFPVVDEDDPGGDGDLIMENHQAETLSRDERNSQSPQRQVDNSTRSKAKAKAKPKAKEKPAVRRQPARGRATRARRQTFSEQEEDDEDDDDAWQGESDDD